MVERIPPVQRARANVGCCIAPCRHIPRRLPSRRHLVISKKERGAIFAPLDFVGRRSTTVVGSEQKFRSCMLSELPKTLVSVPFFVSSRTLTRDSLDIKRGSL